MGTYRVEFLKVYMSSCTIEAEDIDSAHALSLELSDKLEYVPMYDEPEIIIRKSKE